MTSHDNRRHLLRAKSDDGHAVVAPVELFFDLVFVFAITQISHLLLHHLSLAGAFQTAVILVAVWWIWVYTSWVTNWLDPNAMPVRLLLFALMIAGLMLAAAIPHAFDSRALWFAVVYATMQVGRSLYMLWALRGHDPANHRNFLRITVWLCVSGALAIAGALSPGPARIVLWTAAVAIDSAGAAFGFWVPGLGRSRTRDWQIAGGHLAERCSLFVIIALGESLLLTGATFAELEWSTTSFAGMLVCVLGSIAMWWIYFNVGAERAGRLIAASDDPGALGRLAYTYIHILIVAGIIVCAVSDELVLKHDHGDLAARSVIAGGPALFLLGCLLFKWATAGWPPLSHLVGLVGFAVLFVVGAYVSPLVLGGLSTALLLLVGLWESVSLRDEVRELHQGGHEGRHGH